MDGLDRVRGQFSVRVLVVATLATFLSAAIASVLLEWLLTLTR